MVDWRIVLGYFAIMSLVTFALFCIDKSRAKRQAWRIPEATLLGASLIGGAFGGLVAMYAVHHKTRKPKFKFGLPVMLVAHIAIAVFLFQP